MRIPPPSRRRGKLSRARAAESFGFFLMTAGDQDNRRRFGSGPTSLFGSDACRLRRRAIWSTACWRSRQIGGGDNLVLRTGLTIPVASGSRMRGKGKSRKGGNDEELLHGRAPFTGSLLLPQPETTSNAQTQSRKGKDNRHGLGVPTWSCEVQQGRASFIGWQDLRSRPGIPERVSLFSNAGSRLREVEAPR
jgi:hypothetical protein